MKRQQSAERSTSSIGSSHKIRCVESGDFTRYATIPILPTLWLNCIIKGENIVFVIEEHDYDHVVSNLKKAIQSERALDTLKDVGPHVLELWKVSTVDD